MGIFFTINTVFNDCEDWTMSITFESMIDEWKLDSRIDQTKVIDEIVRTSSLHSKYLNIYMHVKAKLAAAEKRYNTMKWTKRKYFRGQLERHELESFGWSQWQGLKPSNTELNDLFEADRDLNDLLEKVNYYKSFSAGVEYIMKAIAARQWDLKTLSEHQKFLVGV